tara:strand:- start:1054 stop:1617 length:564 start_codon:yes stop_codon:yes gene_type:complete
MPGKGRKGGLISKARQKLWDKIQEPKFKEEEVYKIAAQPFYDAAREAENKRVNLKSSHLDIQQEGDERFLLPKENPLSYKYAEDGLGVTVTATPVRKRGTVSKISQDSSLSSLNETSTDAGSYFKSVVNTPYGNIIDTDYEVHGGNSLWGTKYPRMGDLEAKEFNYKKHAPKDRSTLSLLKQSLMRQ